MQNGHVIKKNWILLDTCSTDRVTKQLGYVEYVKKCTKDKDLTLYKNGGSPLFGRKGRLTFLPLSVHVNNNSIAKIISLKYVNNIAGMRMTMDTNIEKAMNIILSDGTVFMFKGYGSGLYYYYMASTDEYNSAKNNATITPDFLLSTVTENKKIIQALILKEMKEREDIKDF